ncbi:MAG: DUF2325 domain-containing protein [Alphaproteobacteria bacterium]
MSEEPPLATTPQRQPARGMPRRYKIWEIPGTVQCSIVGTCLDRRDIQTLMRKGKVRTQPGATEYQIHGYVVQEATQPGLIGQLIHKTLDRKYAPQVARVGRLREPAALAAYWNDACAKGQVAGAYWGLMSHRHVGDKLRYAAFGDVHMLSHFMGGANRADAQALWASERRVAELEQRLERVRRRSHESLAERDARIAALEHEIQQMRSFCIRLRPHASRPERTPGCDHPAKQERRRRQQERRLAAARARIREQDREIAGLKAQMERLEELPVCPIQRPTAAEVPEACPLAASRLLYVGGRTSAVPHLRTGAARRRAELLHHDGGIEHRLEQLEDLVARADLVFCPVDCVSHSACLLARDLCKRANKPFVPLRSAGVTHFRRALDRLQPAEEAAACSSR